MEALRKRKPLTEAHKEKLRRIFKGRVISEECREKMRLAHIGQGLSKEIREKISASLTGKRHSKNTKRKMSLKKFGEKNPNWKGDCVGYSALHYWVYVRLGKPKQCEHCRKDGLTGMQIHWANKSGLYMRDTVDWLRLCAECHRNYDLRKVR